MQKSIQHRKLSGRIFSTKFYHWGHEPTQRVIKIAAVSSRISRDKRVEVNRWGEEEIWYIREHTAADSPTPKIYRLLEC